MSRSLYLVVFLLLATLGARAQDLLAYAPTANHSVATDSSAPEEISAISAPKPVADAYFGGPQGLAEVTGVQMNMIGGMSYQNPSFGGFAQTRWASSGRINAWSTTELSNDKKVYNKDGWYITNTSEVGVRVSSRLVPTFVTYYGRQSNSEYKKAMASVGGGLRVALSNSLSVYSQYLFPDFLSFNRTKRLVFGVDSYFPLGRKTPGYFGAGESLVFFDQPRDGAIDHLAGMEASVKIGIVFGRSHE